MRVSQDRGRRYKLSKERCPARDELPFSKRFRIATLENMIPAIAQLASQSVLSIFTPAIVLSVVGAIFWAFIRVTNNSDPKKLGYKRLPGPRGQLYSPQSNNTY